MARGKDGGHPAPPDKRRAPTEIPLLHAAPDADPLHDELRAVYMSRETLIRQMSAVEHSYLHQQQQNTLLRETIARLVLKYGDLGDGRFELHLLVTDAAGQMEPMPELIVDTDDDGMHFFVREELHPVEPMEVHLGEEEEASPEDPGDDHDPAA